MGLKYRPGSEPRKEKHIGKDVKVWVSLFWYNATSSCYLVQSVRHARFVTLALVLGEADVISLENGCGPK